jgi:hypothetical protein
MRWTAICLNVILISTLLFFCITQGVPSGGRDIFLVALMFVAPISSLIALFFIGGQSWPALYLKRKALEEKRKIDSLSGQEKRDPRG